MVTFMIDFAVWNDFQQQMSACAVSLIVWGFIRLYLKDNELSRIPVLTEQQRELNRSPQQHQCLPVRQWTLCPRWAPQGNLSWQCVRLQVELGESGPSASCCCWRRETETELGADVLFVLLSVNVVSVLSQLRPLRDSNSNIKNPHPHQVEHYYFKCQNTFRTSVMTAHLVNIRRRVCEVCLHLYRVLSAFHIIKSDCASLILRRLEVMQEAGSDVTVTPGISMQSVSGRDRIHVNVRC